MICMTSKGYDHVKLDENFDVEKETAVFVVTVATKDTYGRVEYTDFAEAARAYKKAAKKLEKSQEASMCCICGKCRHFKLYQERNDGSGWCPKNDDLRYVDEECKCGHFASMKEVS